MPKILAIIPARNEAESLPSVIATLRAERPDLDILVVDDASTDTTADILPALGVRWLTLVEQLGVGGTVQAGLRYAAWLGYDVVVRVDGDGQHPARQIPDLLAPIRAGVADAVVGSRYAHGAPYCAPWIRRIVQRAVSAWVSAATGRRLTDATSGFWAFGPRAVRLLARHHPTGYPEPELLIFLCRNGLRLVEVPIEMKKRLAGRTSLTVWRLALAGARTTLALLVGPLRAQVREAGRE